MTDQQQAAHGLKLRPTRAPGDPWYDVEINRLLTFQRWSDSWKARLGWLAGLTLLRLRWVYPDHPIRPYWVLTIACRHWPHLLCWQWLLEFRLQRGAPYEYRRLCAFIHRPRHWSLRLLWLFDLHWASQGYDYMAAEPFESSAPQIYPLHEGEARTRVH